MWQQCSHTSLRRKHDVFELNVAVGDAHPMHVPQRYHALCEVRAHSVHLDSSILEEVRPIDDVVKEFHLQSLRHSVANPWRARSVKVCNSAHEIGMKRARHKPPNRLWLSCLICRLNGHNNSDAIVSATHAGVHRLTATVLKMCADVYAERLLSRGVGRQEVRYHHAGAPRCAGVCVRAARSVAVLSLRAALLSLPFLAWLVVHWCLTLHIALPPARLPEDLRRSLVVLPAESDAPTSGGRQGTIAPTAQSLPNALPNEPLPSDATAATTHDAELTTQGEATAQTAQHTSASRLPACGLLLAIPTMPRGGTVDYLNLTIEALLSHSMVKVLSPTAAHAAAHPPACSGLPRRPRRRVSSSR